VWLRGEWRDLGDAGDGQRPISQQLARAVRRQNRVIVCAPGGGGFQNRGKAWPIASAVAGQGREPA
jgi:hypothetical protein